jgi:hypothetical protein
MKTKRKIVIDIDAEVLKNVDVADELDIREGNESEEMRQQTKIYAWYAVLASKARMYREAVEASTQLRVRGEWADTKTTESFIDALVKNDERYQYAREKELLFANLRDAAEMKANMLQSLCAWLRSEREKNLTVLRDKVSKTLNH